MPWGERLLAHRAKRSGRILQRGGLLLHLVRLSVQCCFLLPEAINCGLELLRLGLQGGLLRLQLAGAHRSLLQAGSSGVQAFDLLLLSGDLALHTLQTGGLLASFSQRRL